MIIFIYCNTEGGEGQDRSKALQSSPSAEGKRFRRSGGLPPEARLALPGGGMFAMTWRGIAAVWRRRVPGSPGGDKRGQGTDGSLSPLDTPDPPLDATPSGRASKCEGPTGAFGAPRHNP